MVTPHYYMVTTSQILHGDDDTLLQGDVTLLQGDVTLLQGDVTLLHADQDLAQLDVQTAFLPKAEDGNHHESKKSVMTTFDHKKASLWQTNLWIPCADVLPHLGNQLCTVSCTLVFEEVETHFHLNTICELDRSR